MTSTSVVQIQAPETYGYDEPHPDISGTKADTVQCESLRISYKDPHSTIGERLTEDVFLDPRDSWCGPGGILFVTANALTALQKELDTRYNYFRSSQETIDTCRHDYMRELQYLVEELTRRKREDPKSSDTIDALLDRIQEKYDQIDKPDHIADLDKEEVAEVVALVGPRVESDEELIRHMQINNLSKDTKCELTLRILLKQMHLHTDELVAERERLQKIVGPLDGDGKSEKVVDALLAAAKAENATVSDLIQAIQGHMRTDETRQAVEDVVTEKLRSRYASLQDKYDELLPRIEDWRRTLAEMEMQEARLFNLKEEAEQMNEEMNAKEEVEAAKKAAWEAKNDPVKKALLIQMKAADASNMSEEDRNRMKTLQIAEDKADKDCAELRAAIEKYESEMSTYNDRKAELQAMIPDLERDHRYAEMDAMEAEEKFEAIEARERLHRNEELEAIKQREYLEDEHAAALAPPPSNRELIRLEEQVQEAKQRNEELRAAEESIYARERRYEGLCANAESAWIEEEARRAAEAEAKRLAEEEAKAANRTCSKQSRRLIGDPLDLKYHERYKLPEVAGQSRYLNMYVDQMARDRRNQRMYNEKLAEEEEKIISAAESVGVFGAGFAAPKQAQAHIPVLFRRPEDLRVRLAGSEITVGHVDKVLSEHQSHTAHLAADLRKISSQITSLGAESFRLHTEAQNELIAMQNGGIASNLQFPDSALSKDLTSALAEHQVALEHAEQVWQQAEQICERNLGEAEVLGSEHSCSVRERELTAATRCLYSTASQAASDAAPALAESAQRCVLGLQAAEPQLTAARDARNALWPRAAELSERLRWERQVQDGLESFLRDETSRRDLLDKERKAPDGEAKRALASMRAVLSAGLPSAEAGLLPRA